MNATPAPDNTIYIVIIVVLVLVIVGMFFDSRSLKRTRKKEEEYYDKRRKNLECRAEAFLKVFNINPASNEDVEKYEKETAHDLGLEYIRGLERKRIIDFCRNLRSLIAKGRPEEISD